MGRRGNGLRAQAYIPLVDLDPRLADAMLVVLRDAGVAAYAAPVLGEVGGYLELRLPDRPTDRLYVDVDAKDLAHQVLRTHLPDLREGHESHGAEPAEDGPLAREGSELPQATGARDDDAAWRQIVASFDTMPSDPVPPWPPSEDLDEDLDGEPDDETSKRAVPGRVVRQGQGAPDEPDDDAGGDDEHFVPPPPPPLPRPDPVTMCAWVALFGGPVYLLVAATVGWQIPGWAAFVAVAAFVGGFVTLVLRMDDGGSDSGPDDGAVV